MKFSVFNVDQTNIFISGFDKCFLTKFEKYLHTFFNVINKKTKYLNIFLEN